MIAASAPENGAASLVRDIVEAPSWPSGDVGRPDAPAMPPATAPSRGDCGVLPVAAFAIIGDAEFIEPRWDSMLFLRLRIRRVMKKARMPDATSARKPRTTITAIAQCGNVELAADWTEPVLPTAVDVGPADCRLEGDPDEPEPEGFEVAVAEDAAAADLDDAADTDAADADADAAEAAEAEDMDATTESA